MKRYALALAPLMLAATPAHATGGLVCRTAGPSFVQINIGFGHGVGAALLQDATRLTDNGRAVAVVAPQWWLDDSELRLLLTDRNGMRREAIVKARRSGRTYDGSLWRNGRRQWIRCREG